MMKKLIYILFFGMLFACEDKDDKPQITCPECEGDILCTEEFRTLSFTITNPAGEPIILDEFEVTIIETGEVLDHGDWLGQLIPGAYVVAQDSDFEKIDCDGTDIRFEGFLADEKVIDEVFVVARDCCHIFLLEGPDTIVLQ